MKKLLLAALLPWLCLAFLQAQQTLPQKLQHFYAPLDKSQVTTGFLYDQTWSFVSPLAYRGVLTDSNFVSPDVFGMLYGGMRGAQLTALELPSPQRYLSRMREAAPDGSVPIAALALRYDLIRPDAVTQNLLTISNGQIFDVQGRAQSPYLQDTLYMAALLRPEARSRKLNFELPADLLFQNVAGAAPSISIDPGDGNGWRTLTPDQPLEVEYDTDGEKEVALRFEYADFTRYSHSKLNILPGTSNERDGGMTWPQNLYESLHVTASQSYMGATGGATLHFFYNTHNCNSVKRLIRPLIVVEGYEDGIVSNTYERMFRLLNAKKLTSNSENLTDYLYPYEYDLIYVDFDNGSDWIQRNAFVVKEVIKKVNEMKAAAGSTEENVIIGVSMGGIVSKYALLDMQTNGPDHDTRLFFTYDSPLRGANIPIATQCFVKFMVDNLPTYAGDQISIPSIEAVWNALQAPVPRQLLKYHVNGLFDGTGLDNTTHAAFMAELDALGALNMRHVALSNGAGTGTFIENNMVAGQLFFELDGQKVECKTIWLPGPTGIPIPYVFCGDLRFSVRLRATGGNGLTTLFYGYIEKDLPFQNPLSTTWALHATTKPYDTSPGGNTNLGVAPLGNGPGGLMTLLTDAGVTTNGPGLTATHHCFEATYSSVSATEPANFGTPVTCGTANRCTTASQAETSPYSGLPEINQAHIFLDERIALVLVDELVTNSPPPPVHPLASSGQLDTYFNVGLAIYSPIPTLTISTADGNLSINNKGKVAFATNDDPESPHDFLSADTKCDAVITVEDGAKLVVGADQSMKHGQLRVNEGSVIHIKPGGMLNITSDQSQLWIKHGATLILDPGAIIRLESPGSNINIQGDLIINGDIKFEGLGYFDFDEGNRLIFGPGYNTFNLTGAGKDKRFVRLSANVQIDNHHRLNWRNGLVEVNGKLSVTEGAGLDFTFMTLTGNFTGYNAIDAFQSGPITLQGCKVEKLSEAIVGLEGIGCTVLGCEFLQNSAWSILWNNAFAVTVKNSIFDGTGNCTSAILMQDMGFLVMDGNHFSGYTTAIDLDNAVACAAKNCHFTGNAIGINAANPSTGTTANVFAYDGSTFTSNVTAIYVEGDATKGAVLADCVLFDQNIEGISGRDITLMIDSWNSKIFAFDTDSPNTFIRDNAPQGGTTLSHVDICFHQKAVGGSNLMRNNFWGIASPGLPFTDPAPQNWIFLKQNACSVNIAPVFIPFGSKDAVCMDDERPTSFANTVPGAECTLSVGTPGGNNTSISVHQQFHLGTYLMKADSLEAGIEAMRPVAALWQSDLTMLPNNCQQYIKVAKAFVDASDSNLPGLPRPSGGRNHKSVEEHKLMIMPNPTDEVAMLHLTASISHIMVWNPQGKLMHQANASNTYSLSTSGWPNGVYFIEAVSQDGHRSNGKLLVQH